MSSGQMVVIYVATFFICQFSETPPTSFNIFNTLFELVPNLTKYFELRSFSFRFTYIKKKYPPMIITEAIGKLRETIKSTSGSRT